MMMLMMVLVLSASTRGLQCSVHRLKARSISPIQQLKALTLFTWCLSVPVCWSDDGLSRSSQSITCDDSVVLTGVRQIGEGGSGTVYSGRLDNLMAVAKVSSSRSQASVVHECDVLRRLARLHIDNIETCLCCSTYRENLHDSSSSSSSTSRQVIVLQPFFTTGSSTADDNNVVSTLATVRSKQLQLIATESLLSTTVQMIRAGVALSDVQVLVNPDSGSLILIDLTESKEINQQHPSYNDLALVRSFISEAMSLVPEELAPSARQLLAREVLQVLASSDDSQQVGMSAELRDLLREYLQ